MIQRLLILIALLAVALTAAAQRVSDPELDELQALLDAGDYTAADGLFNELKAKYPNDAYLRSHYGVFLFIQGDNEGAITALKEAVEVDDTYSVAYNNLGYVLMMSGRPEEAFEAIKEAALLNPNDSSTLNNLAGCIVYLGDLDNGMALYKELQAKSPDNPRLYNDLGSIYLAIAEYETARGYFEQSLQIDSNYAPATVNLARVEMAGGDFNSAESLLVPLVEAGGAPGTTLWDAITALYLNKGDIDKAVYYAGKAVELEPSVDNYNNLATVHYLTGKYTLAISAADDGLAIAENAYGLNIRGHSLYFAEMNTEQAEADLERSIELDPYDFTAHKNLGDILFYVGEDGKASAAYEKAVELKPNYYDAWDGIGYANLRLGNYERAKAAFQTVIDAISATDPKALNGMGATLAYEGDIEGAIYYLDMAIKADPEYSDAHNTLGYIYAEMGDFEKALYHQEEANRYNPDDPIQLMNLAIAAYRYGELDKASAAFDRIILLLTPFNDEGSRLFMAEAYGGRALVNAELGNAAAAKKDIEAEASIFGEESLSTASIYTGALIAELEGDTTLYQTELDRFIEEVQRLEQEDPDEPLGFMLEAVYNKAKEK